MTRPFRARLSCERLENRDTPATISTAYGNLLIRNNVAAIQVTQDSSGAFTVTDGATSYGPYSAVNNIYINTLNGNDTITVSLFAGKLLPGMLSINSANGNDTISVFGNGSGRIGTNLAIYASNGNDAINIGRTDAGVNSGLKVSGATIIAAGTGLDSVNVGTAIFGNIVSATQANTIDFGAGGGVVALNGNFAVDNRYDFAATNSLAIETGATIAGSLTYLGGSGDDSVDLSGTVCTVPSRSVTVDGGAGNSTFTFSGTVGVFVLANLTFRGSNNPLLGTDSISVAGTAKVSNHLTLLMGNGVNLYSLATNFSVGGNLTIAAGSDDDNLGAIDANVGGSVNVSLGSGNDTVEFGTSGLGVGSIGGSLYVNAGDGDDSVSLNESVGSGTGKVAVYLGAGADTFGACDPLYSAYGSATIDFGIDADNDQSTVLLTALSPNTIYANTGGGDMILFCPP